MYFRRRKMHRRNRLQFLLLGFSEALVVCVCFLTTILVRTAMSAPASHSNSLEFERMNSRPKWINPCGNRASDDFHSKLDGVPHLSDNGLLSSIVVSAKNTLMQAERFQQNYTKNTFNMNFDQIYQEWKAVHYGWLPTVEELSKSLGEKIPYEVLEKLDLDMALKDTYRHLQKYAVGMEQVVWDQMDRNETFKNQFADIEFKLRATLCEIQAAMLERGVAQHDNITRQIMGNEMRQVSNSSYRNVRDWVIFRDCMNGLEFVIQVFEFFKEKLVS